MPRKSTSTLSYVGYILALLGGILLILFGLFNLLDVGIAVLREIPRLSLISGSLSALVQIAIGVICVIGSRFISKLVWAIVLLVLGVVTGNLGGALVAIGAILGLVSVLIKSGPN